MVKRARPLYSQWVGVKGTSSRQPVVLGDDAVAVRTCRHRQRRLGVPACSHLGLILFLGEHPTYEGSVQLLLVGIGGGGRIGGTSESTGRSEHISTEQALLL